MHLIFDFDGTLVDSFDCVIKEFNRLAEEHQFRKIALDEVDELRHLSSKELIALFRIPFYKIPHIIHRAKKSFHNNIYQLQPFKEIPFVIEALFKQGFTLGIVSSNSKENVLIWLKQHKIDQYFGFIHAGSPYLGKRRILKTVLKNQKVKQAFYIGDETRDIEAAKQSNIYSMAVTWGFNSEKILKQYNPHCIAYTPEHILDLCLGYQNKKILF